MVTYFVISCLVLVAAALIGLIALRWSVSYLGVVPESCMAADAIVLHTYMVGDYDALPYRGFLVAYAAGEFCDLTGKPLIIASGFASRRVRTDQAVYADHITSHFPNVQIILGEDDTVRSTTDEIREASRIAAKHGWKNLAAFALAPHVPRVAYHWAKQPRQPVYAVCSVKGPMRFYLWEAAMVVIEMLLPPNSKRRERVLNLFRGKGAAST